MPHKSKKPTLEAYFGTHAAIYSTEGWMARNQHRTSQRAVQLLLDAKLGPLRVPLDDSALILDAACGSGYSSDVLAAEGLPFAGADLSIDMLRSAAAKGYPAVNCDLRRLPFRAGVFAHGISISGLNFVADGARSITEIGSQYLAAASEFARVVSGGGRFAIEFYPGSSTALDQALVAFKKAGFRGFLVVDNPGGRKEQKFLVVEKQ